MEGNNFHYLLKFLIIGESGVGKSCLVLNFTEQKPRKHHQVTIACEFAARTVEIKGKRLKVQMWDTAGQENFRSITRSYYRSAIAALIVYDITSRSSFDKVTSWLTELKENSHSQICLALVGNKLDLEKNREVSYVEGLNFAKSHKMRFTETCAFETTSVEPLFKGLAEDVLTKIETKVLDSSNEQLGIKIGDLSKAGRSPSPYSGRNTEVRSNKLVKETSEKKKKQGCCK